MYIYIEHDVHIYHVPITFDWLRSSGNVKTPISPLSSRNKEKKVTKVQKPVVEKRQEEVENKYVKQKSRANSIQTKYSNYAIYYRLEILILGKITAIIYFIKRIYSFRDVVLK